MRRAPGRDLHRRRDAAIGDEHESGAHVRAGAAGAHRAVAVDLLHRAAVRHARRRRTVRATARHRRRALRKIRSPDERALHLQVPPHGAIAMTQYDVLIIGSGAGGGTLAYHLAPSGKTILIIERGDYV